MREGGGARADGGCDIGMSPKSRPTQGQSKVKGRATSASRVSLYLLHPQSQRTNDQTAISPFGYPSIVYVDLLSSEETMGGSLLIKMYRSFLCTTRDTF